MDLSWFVEITHMSCSYEAWLVSGNGNKELKNIKMITTQHLFILETLHHCILHRKGRPSILQTVPSGPFSQGRSHFLKVCLDGVLRENWNNIHIKAFMFNLFNRSKGITYWKTLHLSTCGVLERIILILHYMYVHVVCQCSDFNVCSPHTMCPHQRDWLLVLGSEQLEGLLLPLLKVQGAVWCCYTTMRMFACFC